MTNVAIVSDSTADLPGAASQQPGVYIVPLTVAFADGDILTGDAIAPEDFYRRLAQSAEPPTTAQPSPTAFEDIYARCAADGFDRVVSMHCSAELSGTVGVARQAAKQAPIPVDVVDTRLVGGALGLALSAARRIVAAGGTADDVVQRVETLQEHTISLLVVDTLEYLRRGGRLSGTQAKVGSALRVKPILELADGRVELSERTRTWSRALERVVGMVSGWAAGAPIDIALVHADDEDRAHQLRRLLEFAVDIRDESLAPIGPIVGTHVGPGAVGIAAVVHSTE